MLIYKLFGISVLFINFNCYFTEDSNNAEESNTKYLEEVWELQVGDAVLLNCSAEENGDTYWKFNGDLMILEDDSIILETLDGLSIPSITLADSGKYVCYDDYTDEPLAKYTVKVNDPNELSEEIESLENNGSFENKDDKEINKDFSNHFNLLPDSMTDEQLLNRLEMLESSTFVIHSKMEDRLRQMEEQLESLMRSLSTSSKTESGSSSRSTVIQSETVADQRVLNGKYVIEYTWIIPQLEEEIKRAKDDGSYSLQSPLFYTHRPGYRMRLLFYPDYKNTNTSGLFAGLVQGDYDDVLPWPFPHDYQLMIVSHKPNVVDDVANIRLTITNCNKGVFQRPQSNNPPACGFREFITHTKLQRHKRAFLIYGNLVIKIRLYIN